MAGKDLGNAEAISSDFRGAGGGDKSFVAEEIRGKRVARAGDDDLLDFLELIADFEEFLKLLGAGDKNDLRAAVIQDVGHAIRGFVEVDRNGDAARAVDGEIGGMPFGAIGGKEADTIAGFDAEFDEGMCEAGDAAQHFLGGNGFPTFGAAKHLCARRGVLFDGGEEARRESAVIH